jgi:hypothetical protein
LAAWPGVMLGLGASTKGRVRLAPCCRGRGRTRIGFMTALARRRWVGVVTWSLTGFTVLVLVAALVLLGLDGSWTAAARIGLYGAASVAVVVYAGVGHLLARRRPDNAIGWLLCLAGLSLSATMFSEQYALRGLAVAPRSLPAVQVAGWLSQAAFLLTFAPLLFAVLLFPDGRLPSRRWRPVLWLLTGTVLAWAAQLLQAGTTIVGGMSNALSDAGVAYPNPFGVLPRHGWFSGFLQVVFALAVVTTVLVVVSVFVRRRGANAELRQQLAWLGYVGVLTVVVPGALIVGTLFTGGRSSVLGELFWAALVIIPMVGIPLACAVAVLKYRLYDLDVVVKKTVVAGGGGRHVYRHLRIGGRGRRGGDRAAGQQRADLHRGRPGCGCAAAGPGAGLPAGRPAGVWQAGEPV